MTLTQISTAGVKDDAVTSGKIPANAVGSSELADNAVDTAAIADDAVTAAKLANTSVSAGSYGSATAIPAITVDAQGRITAASTNNVSIPAGTTINNNADNRVITGSGTANTLEGESTLTYSDPQLKLLSTSAAPQIRINSAADDGLSTRFTLGRATANNHFVNGAHSGDSVISVGADLLFGVQTAEKMRLTSTGKLGIGDTNPQSKLAVSDGGSTADPVIMAHVANSNGGFLGFGLYSTINSKYTFKVTNNGRVHVNDGIDFNMTSNASGMSSELLDDYEEGTFSPTIKWGTTSATSYYNQQGVYTKIGRIVHVQIHLNVNNMGSGTGNAIVEHLPFAVGNIGFGYFAPMGIRGRINSGANNEISAYVSQNSTQLYIYRCDHSGFNSNTTLTHSNFATQSEVDIMITYPAAS